MVGAMRQSDPLKPSFGRIPRISRPYAGNEQRHHHVLDRGEFRQQVMKLKDDADMAIAHL
jgi:hypothetical protein